VGSGPAANTSDTANLHAVMIHPCNEKQPHTLSFLYTFIILSSLSQLMEDATGRKIR
jgi:hypothetical protein